MSKLTRGALKSIVKECLVEILSEGLMGNTMASRKKIIKKSNQTKNVKAARAKNENRDFDEKIKNTVSSITSDNIMQEILADTARTTLQEQMSQENRRSSSSYLLNDENGNTSQAGIDISEMVDQTSSNWSHLAFADKKK
jgi:hypothetical protein